MLGVNLGNLGFLVEIEPAELPDALDRLERLDFTIEEHSGLWLGADADEAVAFNDLAFVRVPGDGVVEAALAVGGQRMGRYRCDGLVISTSIGSTAYAYSAGGPLVSPALDAVVVAALAPLAGISRPLVTSADEPIRLTLQPGSGCPAIEVDGRMLRRTEPGDVLDVRLKPGCGLVVRLDSDRYQRRNQVKLSLLDLPYLPDELRQSPLQLAARADRPAAGARALTLPTLALILTGPPGAGKSSVLTALVDALSDDDIAHAALEIEMLAWTHPALTDELGPPCPRGLRASP